MKLHTISFLTYSHPWSHSLIDPFFPCQDPVELVILESLDTWATKKKVGPHVHRGPGVLNSPLLSADRLWFCLPVSCLLPQDHLFLLLTSSLLKPYSYHVSPVATEACDTDTGKTDRLCFLHMTMSHLGPWLMGQSQTEDTFSSLWTRTLDPLPPRSPLRVPSSYFPFTPLSMCALLQDQGFLAFQSPFSPVLYELRNGGETSLCWI